MSFSVMTNSNSLAALESLSVTQHSLSQAQARISSGFKVASAADGPSTFAIAQGMRGDIAALQSVSDSVGLAQSVVSVASSAAQTVSNDLNQLKAAVTSAQDPTQNKADIQDKVTALLNEITSTVNAAQFNGVNILSAANQSLVVNTSLNRTGPAGNATNVALGTMILGGAGAAKNLDLTLAGGNLAGINGINVTAPTDTTATFTLGSTPAIMANDAISVVAGGITHTYEFIDANNASSAPLSTSDATHVVTAISFNSTVDNTQAALNKAFTAMATDGFSGQFLQNGNFTISGTGLTASAYTPSGVGTQAAGVANATTTIAGAPGVGGAATLGTNQVQAVENAITNVSNVMAQIGAFQNELQDQSTFVKSLTDALTSGVGNLVDADMAAESANLQAAQTRQSLGIQALSIANQGPSAVMSLFR